MASPARAARAVPMVAWLAVAAAIAAADQLAKLAVAQVLAPGEVVRVTSFFNLVHVFNRGAAFSFLAGAGGWQRAFFVAVTLVAAALILHLLRRHAGERRFSLGLTLILGGAIGNLWDRVALGHVVDFLDFHVAGWHWPAFNVADTAITLGAAVLVLDALLAGRRGKAGPRP